MTEAEAKVSAEAEVEEEAADAQDIFYVCQKALESVKELLKASGEITQEKVNELTFPENLPDEEVMVPVDMRGVGDDFDDVEQMVEKLGPKGAAEAFVKAAEYFAANKDKEPDEERPKPMSAKEWRVILEEDAEDGFADEGLLEGEEEEQAFDEEEAEEEEADGEPAAKKAKTD